MAWWHRVGQRVVCKFDPHPGWLTARPDVRFPRKDEVCVITHVKHDPDNWDYGAGDGDLPLFFRIDKEPLAWFGHVMFAPVKNTSIESLRAILTSPPDPALLDEEMSALTRDAVKRLAEL